ncbi:MAG TPA: radical SAM protein [Anaerolineaceae bacterium]
MDPLAKLASLAENMRFEPSEELILPHLEERRMPGFGADQPRPPEVACPAGVALKDLPIYRAVGPGGRRMPLLKTLLTSACERDCYYCACRAGRDFRRATFQPDELARTFMELHRARRVDGLFLSSGVAGGGVRTQDRLIATAEILRGKLGFRGYLHLKLMPGAEWAQVERAMQLADRVSINLEAPNTARLGQLAPHKTFLEELLTRLEWVEQIRQNQPPELGWKGRWPSTTTQFVVGGADETDLELLQTTQGLYRRLRLARAYYSGFAPVAGTPLEERAAVDPWRQSRLYQASFLLRDYGFDVEDLPFGGSGALPLDVDPKLAWARLNLAEAPLEINRADRHELLRIPGIGPKSAETILQARAHGKLTSLEGMKALGIPVRRAVPFLLIDGRRPETQLSFFANLGY